MKRLSARVIKALHPLFSDYLANAKTSSNLESRLCLLREDFYREAQEILPQASDEDLDDAFDDYEEYVTSSRTFKTRKANGEFVAPKLPQYGSPELEGEEFDEDESIPCPECGEELENRVGSQKCSCGAISNISLVETPTKTSFYRRIVPDRSTMKVAGGPPDSYYMFDPAGEVDDYAVEEVQEECEEVQEECEDITNEHVENILRPNPDDLDSVRREPRELGEEVTHKNYDYGFYSGEVELESGSDPVDWVRNHPLYREGYGDGGPVEDDLEY